MLSKYYSYLVVISALFVCAWSNATYGQGRRDVTDAGSMKLGVAGSATSEVFDEEAIAAEMKSVKPSASGVAKVADEASTPVLTKIEKNTQDSTSDSTLFRMIAGLAVVACMGAGALFYIRRKATIGSLKKDGTEIRLVSQHHLGPRKSIAVVKVAGESVLIGVTDQQITLLKTLTLLDDENDSFEDLLDQSALEESEGILDQFRPKSLNDFTRRRSNMRT